MKIAQLEQKNSRLEEIAQNQGVQISNLQTIQHEVNQLQLSENQNPNDSQQEEQRKKKRAKKTVKSTNASKFLSANNSMLAAEPKQVPKQPAWRE